MRTKKEKKKAKKWSKNLMQIRYSDIRKTKQEVS